MPFTPLHLGPALLIGVVLRRRLDVFAILVGSVVLDIEPFLVLCLGLSAPLHGLCHTYLAALLLSPPLSAVLYHLRDLFKPLLHPLGLSQQSSFRSVIISSMIGLFSHVTLDATLYAEMVPFYPFFGNPLLGVVNYTTVYEFCIVTGIFGFLLHVFVLAWWSNHSTDSNVPASEMST